MAAYASLPHGWPVHPDVLEHYQMAIPNGIPTGTIVNGYRPANLQICQEVKAQRLTREQHDILEQHFQLQAKPSTTTKRVIAERMGVPLDKINNWFQNRRAKVKQEMKKALNAAQNGLVPNSVSLQNAPQHYLNSSDPMPSSGPPNMLPSNGPVPSTEIPADAILASSIPGMGVNRSMHQMHAFQHAQQFMIPPGMQNAQVGHQQGMIDMLSSPTSSYPSADGSLASSSGVSFDQSGLTANPTADPNYSLTTHFQEFATPFEVNFPDFSLAQFHASDAASMQAANGGSIPNGSSQGEDGIVGRVAGQENHSLREPHPPFLAIPDWSSIEEKPEESADTAISSPRDPLDSTVLDSKSPHHGSSNGDWSQNGVHDIFASNSLFLEHNGSAPSLVSSTSDLDQMSLADLQPPEFPSEALGRRSSSTTALAEGMSTIDIHSRPHDSSMRKPSSSGLSLAARRQRPRPAMLNSNALRSASYSAGMPQSPGCLTAPPDQALRRIKSSGLGNGSRIQKPLNSASGPRSPMAINFEAAMRQVSSSTVSSPSVPVTASSLAPPTPLTPGFSRNQQSFAKQQSAARAYSLDHVNLNAMQFPMDSENGTIFSSPPSTPLDPDQVVRLRNLELNQSHYRFTPPQSAPATQLCFSAGTLIPDMPTLTPPTMLGDEARHIRRPSLPVDVTTSEASLSVPPVPIFAESALNNLSIQSSFDFGFGDQSSKSESNSPRPVLQSPAPYNIGARHGILKEEFVVHEYSPPTSLSSPPTEAPKKYEFSHQGPSDFRG